MVKTCVYGLCDSKDSDPGEDLKFIRFPQRRYNLKKCKEWVQACGRTDFSCKNVNNFTWICSKHFPLGVSLDFRKNKELQPFPHTGDMVSRVSAQKMGSVGSKGQKTYGRQQRKSVAVMVPVLTSSSGSASTSTSTSTESIDLPGDDGEFDIS